jgi:hypothetical protein
MIRAMRHAAVLALCSVLFVSSAASALGGAIQPHGDAAVAKSNGKKRTKPTCTQLNTAILASVEQLKTAYGAISGGADGTCAFAGRYSLAGGATIGRRDRAPSCMTIACCPATDCIHTDWTWTEILTRNKKGRLVTSITNFRCHRFQVTNGAPGALNTTC